MVLRFLAYLLCTHVWKTTPQLRVIKKYRQRHLFHFSKLQYQFLTIFRVFSPDFVEINVNIFSPFYEKNLEKYRKIFSKKLCASRVRTCDPRQISLSLYQLLHGADVGNWVISPGFNFIKIRGRRV